MKGMKENQILVVIKEPGQEARVEPMFENSLEAFQKAVGGYIESVTVASDVTLICNEEGRLMGLPYCCNWANVDFCGPVIAVGIKGEEFASLKASVVPFVMHNLKEV